MQFFGRKIKRNVHQTSVAKEPSIVPLKGEKYALRDTKRAEHTPSIQITDLAGRKQIFVSLPDLAIMEKVPVHLLQFSDRVRESRSLEGHA